MIFGADRDRGIRLDGLQPEIVELSGDITEADLLVHDETDPALAYVLSRMTWPDYPVPIGVFRRVKRPTFDELTDAQIAEAVDARGKGDLRKLLHGGDSWTVS